MKKEIRIGVDVDGGDETLKPDGNLESASERIADGVRRFARGRPDVCLFLYGMRDSFRGFGDDVPVSCELYHASEFPDKSVRRSVKGSSLNMLALASKEGRIGGFFSAGDTARVSIESLRMGRLKGVGMPTLVARIPGPNEDFFISDAGATGDSSKEEFHKMVIDKQAKTAYKQGIMALSYVERNVLAVCGAGSKIDDIEKRRIILQRAIVEGDKLILA